MAEVFIKEGRQAVSKVLAHSGVASSTWYAQAARKPAQPSSCKRGRPVPGYTVNPDGTLVMDATIVSVLKEYREQIEFTNAGGYHKLTHYLRRDYGFFVNHKKLYRLCDEHGLLLPRNKKKLKKARKLCLNRRIGAPNQLWEFDIKYGYIHGDNRFFFILVFIDVFTRKVIDYHIGLSCKAEDLRFTLDNALRRAGIDDDSGLVIRSDNGPQMSSHMFRDYIATLNLKLDHEFIPPACSNKNAHVESFNSILETEFLQVQYFKNYGDAYEKTVKFIEHYNQRRIHGSLKMRTPNEAEAAWKAGQLMIAEVNV